MVGFMPTMSISSPTWSEGTSHYLIEVTNETLEDLTELTNETSEDLTEVKSETLKNRMKATNSSPSTVAFGMKNPSKADNLSASHYCGIKKGDKTLKFQDEPSHHGPSRVNVPLIDISDTY